MKINRRAVIWGANIAIWITVLISIVYSLARGHLFTVLQGVLTLVLCALPNIYSKKSGVELPGALKLSAVLFVFASTFLGEISGFYTLIPLWDTILHFASGFLTAAVGLSLTETMNRGTYTRLSLSPGFAAFFSFCFSMTTGVVWEFYEFGMDMIFSMDMQKDNFVGRVTSILIGKEHLDVSEATLNGEVLPGLLDIGLIDTMKDLFANAAGAIVFAVCVMLYLKTRGSRWITRFIPRAKRKQK